MRSAFLLAGLSILLSCASSSPNGNGNGGNGNGPTNGQKGGESTDDSAGSRTNARPTEAGGAGGNADTTARGGATNQGESSSAGGKAEPDGADDGEGGALGRGGRSSAGRKNAGGSSADGGANASGRSNAAGRNEAGSSQGTGTDGGRAATAGGSTNVGKGGSASAAAGGGNASGGGAQVGCDRQGLQAAVDAYVAAVQAGDTTLMPLASGAKYSEVAAAKASSVALGDGLWKTAMPIAFQRSLLDETGCETFTELFITEGGHPYAIGTRLSVKEGKVSEIYSIVTDSDDWNFDATAYATCSKSEDWSEIPEAKRSTREELIAAGEAYFEIFSDKNTVVPWGNPCYRLEGGKGCTPAMDKASTSCSVGIPDGITFKNTHWVVDVNINAAVGITLFAGASPDTHLFRLVDGKIRYVHTLTVMN